MKKILIILVVLFLITGCKESNSVKESKGTISSITCNKAIDMQGEGAIMVDVREKSEYDEDHLDDAINIPYTVIVDNISKYADKDTKIIVYCRSGNRSNKAANSLIEAGYKNIYDLGSINNCN